MSTHDQFKPDYTPSEMFEQGIFGGTYFRPIYSSVTNKHYKNKHIWFNFLKHIAPNWICSQIYDVQINKYKVKCGSSLEYWEEHDWITKYDPYGWV